MARVVLLFRRRAIEIHSLRAVLGRKPDVLCIEVAVEGDEDNVPWMEANLYKLVDVLVVERKKRRRCEASARDGGHP